MYVGRWVLVPIKILYKNLDKVRKHFDIWLVINKHLEFLKQTKLIYQHKHQQHAKATTLQMKYFIGLPLVQCPFFEQQQNLRKGCQRRHYV